MIAKRYLYLPLLSIILFAACKKSSVNPNNKQTTPKADTDVYVVGNSSAANGKAVATYWKNGVPIRLTDSSATSSGRSIIIQPNGDIYISGYILGTGEVSGNFNQSAAYWKNGVLTRLDNGPYYSDAFGIAVVGSDVYVGGFTTNEVVMPYATYWKNNIETQFPVGWVGSDVYAVATNGTDVFFAGDSKLTGNNQTLDYRATYWQNTGQRTLLEQNASPVGAEINSITINGNDIYMAGYTYSGTVTPIYSKNGVVTVLNSFINDYANGIATNGTDVYIVGTNYNDPERAVAFYWKNGIRTQLTDGSTDCQANGVVLSGNNVYIAGMVTGSDGKQTACYWKNGIQVKLPKGTNANAQGLGIAVVPH